MTDSLEEHGEGERPRIDLHSAQDVNYWTRRLSISREELVQAVERVGDLAQDVHDHVRQMQAPGAWPPASEQHNSARGTR